MPQEHYFSNEPTGDFKPKTIEVTLADRRVKVQTAGSIFSPDHVDTGTKVLLSKLELAPEDGDILDIGCGWGPISLALAMYRPNATIWAVDVNQRAVELTRKNAASLGLTNVKAMLVDEVPAGLTFDAIWSNPPIRVGKEVLHEILKVWLNRMKTGAFAYLVVQKNLGSDSLLKWLQDTFNNFESTRLSTDKQFRVLEVEKVS